MANHLFLFHGGTYKRTMNGGEGDNGRLRVPLTRPEADLVVYDTELPGDTDNAIGGELHMSRWSDYFDNMAVGDYVYIHVGPDAMGYRGIWAVPQDPVPGMKVEFDLVAIAEIARLNKCGGDYESAETLVPTTELDFASSIGDSPEQAALQSDLECRPYEDFRGTEPGLFEYYSTPFAAKIGQAVYLRMKITALPEGSANSPCSSCSKPGGYPKLHYGLIVDRLCLSKNEWRDFCRCKSPICAGCPQECKDCDPCDDSAEEPVDEL